MKNTIKIFSLIILSLLLNNSYAQNYPYGNEWIDYQKPHFKFKIGEKSFYRISFDELDSLGLGNIPSEHFRIYRDGKEIPLYITNTGQLGSSDFIEFYGYRADAYLDYELYLEEDFQPNPDINLIADTAIYFLTYRDNNNGIRITQENNIIPIPEPNNAPFIWSHENITNGNVRSRVQYGESLSNTDYFYSSDFSSSSGYAYNRGTNVTSIIGIRDINHNIDTTASVTIHYANIQYNNNQNNYQVRVNNHVILDTAYTETIKLKKLTSEVPISALPTANQTLRVQDQSSQKAIYYGFIKYPRLLEFSGTPGRFSNFYLPPNTPYLKIKFANTQGAPIAYNMDDNKRYEGVVQGSQNQFYFGSQVEEKFYLISAVQNIKEITDFTSVTFNDLSTAYQADYIILSSKTFINQSPNYLQEYADFRSSSLGGAYNVSIVDVEDLYDQFAYGQKYHPLAIRHFLKYAQVQSNNNIDHLFIVGKGLSWDRIYNKQRDGITYDYEPIPTIGAPGSDLLLSAFDKRQPTIATGRLSIMNNEDLGIYLSKVQAYTENIIFKEEDAYSEHALWKKRALHIAGGSDLSLQSYLVNSLNNAETKYRGPFIGGNIFNLKKNTTDPIDQGEYATVNSHYENGINLITFFGHSSPNGFDYNLNNPNLYNANGRFPNFLALGCDVANIFYSISGTTIGENYLTAENGGSVTMIASNNLGYTNSLNQYLQSLYVQMSDISYGETFGKQYLANVKNLQLGNSRFLDAQMQGVLFQGDPAIRFAHEPKPDLAVLESTVKTDQQELNTSLDSFKLIIPIYNFGKTVNDSILITISKASIGEQDGFEKQIWIEGLNNTDTLQIDIPVTKEMAGMNIYQIHIDADNRYEEMTKGNNLVQKSLFISSFDIIPLYPEDFGIVYNENSIKLKASTINSFEIEAEYIFEFDTTALFDSQIKQSHNITSTGGVLMWEPSFTLEDSTVYYWRVARVTEDTAWHNRSFIYLADGSSGWNQSHFYQYKQDEFEDLLYEEPNREFEYTYSEAYYIAENIFKHVYESEVRHNLNDVALDFFGCAHEGGILITVFDSISGQPWIWDASTAPAGSYPPCKNEVLKHNFEFSTTSLESRNQAIDFINSIPDNCYISIRSFSRFNLWVGGIPSDWLEDTLVNGSGNSLYHTLSSLGATVHEEITGEGSFIFFRKKGDNNYPIHEVYTNNNTEKIILDAYFPIYRSEGTIISTVVGPASEWTQFNWMLSDVDLTDSSFVEIYGLDHNQSNPQLLKSITNNQEDLNDINTNTFPYLQLKWESKNDGHSKSAHLDYWRILYQPLPELGLSPNYHFAFTDSTGQLDTISLDLSIHSLSNLDMDSVSVRLKVIDKHLEERIVKQEKFKPLLAHDSLHISMSFPSNAFPGDNTLIIEANPDLEQPEQYYPNNIGYKKFYVDANNGNPLIDVTFDGIYILDKDIVSSKPEIDILFKDSESNHLLSDTSLFEVFIQKPNTSDLEKIDIDGITCIFHPADLSSEEKNQARIDYRPHFLEDGVYKLVVKTKKVVENSYEPGLEYSIRFTVINKSTITNILNYPNPFSTATRFVYTLTGSEIPTQFKIQILSITGKVVREITQAELGPIRIGRNISEYVWDGTDEYGQLLGNGVYLYRVVSNIKGEAIEHRSNEDIDKYFKNGYGKLYIMR